MCSPLFQILPALVLALPLLGVASCLAEGSESSTRADGADGPAAAAPGAPSGYTVLASEGPGRTLFVLKPDIHSAKAAALAALRDLGKVFDDKPLVSGAFGDAEDKQCRGSFTAKLKGQALKGFVACGIGANGAAVTVVYDRAEAAASELAVLLAALPVSRQWVVHPLSGGSGTLSLPSDWKITQSTAIGGVLAEGPSGQTIGLGVGAQVVSPNSPIAAQVRASASMLVAPYSDPVGALTTLMPQLSVMSQRKGGPALSLKRIISSSPATAQIPSGRAAWIECAFTQTSGGKAVDYREKALMECYPIGPLGWAFSISYGAAPERIYDRDLPLMIEIAKSWKLNDSAIRDNTASMINDQNRAVAAFERSMQEKNQAFDRFRQSMRNSELAREKSNADFDEVIRGYRTVEDTQTGYRADVDLGYSKQIVDKLNEKQGFQRYKEIPLRDQ
jgi:hypothetical protein